jgi:nucleoside-diphosphate-sugar epimerase
MSRVSPFEAGRAPRVLVTGIDSFTGTYLERHLSEVGYDVHGIAQAGGNAARIHRADLCDGDALRQIIGAVRPNYVVHLAAISSPAHEDAAQLYLVNVVGTRNLLAALAAAGGEKLRNVILASSANIYGNQECESLTEETAPAPVNDYAVSKLAMEMMARLWMNRIPITITRPFNYTGRGQRDSFLVPKIVDAFRRGDEEIELGNTHIARDFSDVRDVVTCYGRLLGRPGGEVVNICSGRIVSLRTILTMCEEIAGRRMVVRTNPRLVRASEVHRLGGSRARLGALGLPEFRPIYDTLAWMLRSDGGPD